MPRYAHSEKLTFKNAVFELACVVAIAAALPFVVVRSCDELCAYQFDKLERPANDTVGFWSYRDVVVIGYRTQQKNKWLFSRRWEKLFKEL